MEKWKIGGINYYVCYRIDGKLHQIENKLRRLIINLPFGYWEIKL